jgi:hypothetical protein
MHPRTKTHASPLKTLFPKVHNEAGVDTEVVLVIRGPIVERRRHVVRLNYAHGETMINAQVNSATGIGSKSSA